MIEFLLVRNVKEPIRDVNENAGIDMFIPEKDDDIVKEILDFNPKIIIEDNKMIIPPQQDILIPAGVKSKFDKNISLTAANKSGIATKKKLIFGAEIIDSSYHGEIHFHLINWSNEPQTIEFGQKIIQFIPNIISNEEHIVRRCSEDEFFTVKSNRGDGGFGSTGV